MVVLGDARHRCAVTMALCLALAACGGGGGGGYDGSSSQGGGGAPPSTSNWGSAVKLSADRNGSDLVETGVAVNGSGIAFGIWHLRATDEILASRFDGTSWSAATSIGTGTLLPQVAVSAAGDGVVVWTASGTAQARRYTSGSWTAAESLGAITVERVVFTDNSNIVVVGRHSQGTISDPFVQIWTNRFNGSAWTGAVALSSGTSDAGMPTLASAGDGKAVVAWSQGNAFIKRFNAGTWDGSPTQVNVTAGSTSAAIVATNAAGDLVVTWQQNGLLARIYNAANPAGSSEATLDSINPTGQINLEAVLDGDGNAFALWHRMVTTTISNPVAFVSRYSAGSWSTPAMLGTTNTVGHDTPHVRVDGSGNAVAIWSQLATMHSRIYQGGWQSAVSLGSGSTIAFDMATTGQGMAVFNNTVFTGGVYVGATYALRRTP